jgi:hypothetical protein
MRIDGEPGNSLTKTAKFENTSFNQILDEIVNQLKNYEWEIDNGVINIFPSEDRDRRLKELLDLNIADFHFKKGETIRDIRGRIKKLPEVVGFLEKNGLEFAGLAGGPSGVLEQQYGRKLEMEMHYQGLSLRQILNKTTYNKGGGWVLRWIGISSETGNEQIDLDI